MAEIAAGAVVAEVISTTVEGAAVAGYALAQPTLPLKAFFTRLGTAPSVKSPESLARSSNTINHFNGDVYIFGGLVSSNSLAGNEMHILKLSNLGDTGPEYRSIPALASEDKNVPVARAGHTSSVVDGKLIVFGGYTNPLSKAALDEGGKLWSFDPITLYWTSLAPNSNEYPSRYDHSAVTYDDRVIIHGGLSSRSDTSTSKETWSFSLQEQSWIKLPELPEDISMTSPPNFAVVHDRLYVVTSSSKFSSQVLILPLYPSSSGQTLPWTRLEIPTSPLTPGPNARHAAGLHPITTGAGRTYLLLMFGARDRHSSKTKTPHTNLDFCSDMWTLQLPSAYASPAHAKDATQAQLGVVSQEAEWAEVKIEPLEEKGLASEGRAHPGPRGWFGSALTTGGKSVVIWGGMNAKGEHEGDGWTIGLKI